MRDGEARTAADAELVAHVRRGDVGAFAELYRVHVPAVRSVVAHHIAGEDVVSDVVQEAFARALERLDSLREPDHFRSWLLAIAHNTAIDARRERDRVRWVSDGDVEERPSEEDGPETVAELAELGELVNVALAGLGRRDLIALALVSNLGLSSAEIGTALGVSPGAAKVIVHRARGRLRTALSMELMVRRGGAGCQEFADIFDVGDAHKAARHVRDCTRCQALASDDVTIFAVAPPVGGPN